MGIYLGQMPPAELARLKAEIAETLIANFSYPRFFDYRTNTLRMRPVDRAKRQEIWTFLSSFDFNTLSRVDVTSPDFQRQIERLLILFVQRNRAYFGQQGRKRMSDVRALITSSSTSVSEGLRGHLSGRANAQSTFGNPRPVISWSKSNISGKPELSWEQIVNPTMLVQQQLQEVRGEARPGVKGGEIDGVGVGVSADARPVAMNGAANGANGANGATAAPPRRSPRGRAGTQDNSVNETAAAPARSVPPTRPLPQEELRTVKAASGPLSSGGIPASPLPSPTVAYSAPVVEPVRPPAPVEPPVLRATAAEERPVSSTPLNEKVSIAQPRELARTGQSSQSLAKQPDSATVLLSDEDMVIFEQLRHQLIVWLRVEVVRAGLDIAGQVPARLIEILSQQDGVDETRIQVVSTLLNLANQVIANGHATLVEYKQAMMFYLMHTRSAR